MCGLVRFDRATGIETPFLQSTRDIDNLLLVKVKNKTFRKVMYWQEFVQVFECYINLILKHFIYF